METEASAAQKPLGFSDLFFFAAAAGVSIRWISVAAAAGPASLLLWVVAVAAFAAPLCLATADLTQRFDGEGGLYIWAGRVLGPGWGFMAGWIYWACNLPFFAGLLVFMTNLAAAALGPNGRPLLASPPLFAAVAILQAGAVGALHYRGLGAGKWLSNLGGLSTVVLLGVLCACALAALRLRPPATDFHARAFVLPLNADAAILWATMAFAVGGAESIAFLRNDVRGGMKTILRALLATAVLQLAAYMGGTLAMLALISPAAATRLSGLPDALILGLTGLGLAPLAPFVLWTGFLCFLGAYSAWFGVAARLPFAAGLDAHLPKAFGRRDPTTGAPTNAVLAQTAIVVAIVAISQAGATLKGAYDFLVAMSVLSYTLPFILLFWAYWRVQSAPPPMVAWSPPGGARTARLIAGVGGLCVLSAVACTLVPSADEPDKVGAVIKLLGATGALLGAGVLVYAPSLRRQKQEAAPQ